MSMEVEAKAYCEDLLEFERKIRDFGAEFSNEVEQVDTYFNHPARDFAQTDEALRIRMVGQKATFTYKGPKIDNLTKTREEIKVELEDEEVLKEILLKLGFVEVGTVRKVRRKYMFNDLKICLDEVDGLGSFVELEVEVPGDDQYKIDRIRSEILKKLNEWGLAKIERKSYLELLLED